MLITLFKINFRKCEIILKICLKKDLLKYSIICNGAEDKKKADEESIINNK